MSMAPAIRQRRRRNQAATPKEGSDNVLCYMDQASFVGLRALGRQPVLSLTWFYPQPIDNAAVAQFNEELAKGLLGRLLQRSPLPWGRHRWVSSPMPAPVAWFHDPLTIERLPELRTKLAELTIDPEHGPGWRLAVQQLDGGGAALSILVSHTIADGQAVVQAIAAAVNGQPLEHGFPAPSWRWSPMRLAHDSMDSLRALPDVWHALKVLTFRGRPEASTIRHTSTEPLKNDQSTSAAVTSVPLIQIIMDTARCEERASVLKVKRNTLISALAVQLALRMGRLDATGRVNLVLPVSDRQPGERRGNALSSVTVKTDPVTCRSNPQQLQTEIRAALTQLDKDGDGVSDVIPLVPYVPLWLARNMEQLAIRADLSVGCSLLGDLPPELSGPCGKAALLQFSILETFTAEALTRLGGQLFLLGYSLGGQTLVTVCGYTPGRITTRAQLMPLAQEALADIGLDGTIS